MAKNDKTSVRRAVEELLFTLRVPLREIAMALDMDLHIVRNDYRVFGERGVFPEGMEHPSRPRCPAYSHVLHTYSQLLFLASHQDDVDEFTTEVLALELSTLEKYLDVNSLRSIADGVGAVINALRDPDDPPEYRGYRRLLNAVFFREEKMLGAKLLDSYLLAISHGHTAAPDRELFASAMTEWALERYQGGFSLPLDGSVVPVVESVLKNCPKRNAAILHKRFGIGVRQMTLDKIGGEYQLGRERIRQIVVKALRNMRHMCHIKKLKYFVTSQMIAGTPDTREKLILPCELNAIEWCLKPLGVSLGKPLLSLSAHGFLTDEGIQVFYEIEGVLYTRRQLEGLKSVVNQFCELAPKER